LPLSPAGEGTGASEAGAGGRDGDFLKLTPGRDAALSSWRPIKGRAVSSTALAGCGRGRDGRECGERGDPWTICHEGATDPSPEGHGSVTGVRWTIPSSTETSGTPRFLPCCPTVTDALSTLSPLWGTKSRQRVHDPSIPAGKGPPGAGKCDVPGIFVNDRAEVWDLPDTIVTEVRPRTVPVPPPSRKSDLLPSL